MIIHLLFVLLVLVNIYIFIFNPLSFSLYLFCFIFYFYFIQRSSLRLMGAEPLSAVAAKHLPSPDVLSPPEAVFMIAVDSSTAANMPQFQNLIQSGVQAQILHSNGGKGKYNPLSWDVHCSTLFSLCFVSNINIYRF